MSAAAHEQERPPAAVREWDPADEDEEEMVSLELQLTSAFDRIVTAARRAEDLHGERTDRNRQASELREQAAAQEEMRAREAEEQEEIRAREAEEQEACRLRASEEEMNELERRMVEVEWRLERRRADAFWASKEWERSQRAERARRERIELEMRRAQLEEERRVRAALRGGRATAIATLGLEEREARRQIELEWHSGAVNAHASFREVVSATAAVERDQRVERAEKEAEVRELEDRLAQVEGRLSKAARGQNRAWKEMIMRNWKAREEEAKQRAEGLAALRAALGAVTAEEKARRDFWKNLECPARRKIWVRHRMGLSMLELMQREAASQERLAQELQRLDEEEAVVVRLRLAALRSRDYIPAEAVRGVRRTLKLEFERARTRERGRVDKEFSRVRELQWRLEEWADERISAVKEHSSRLKDVEGARLAGESIDEETMAELHAMSRTAALF